MFSTDNPYYDYLRHFHSPKYIYYLAGGLIAFIALKWMMLLMSFNTGDGLIWAYCSGLEILLVPFLPLVTTALIARNVALESQKDQFEATLLTSLLSEKIVRAFVRLLMPPYMLLATLIEFDVLFFILFFFSAISEPYDVGRSSGFLGIEVRLLFYFFLYFGLMWMPLSRGIQAIYFLLGVFYGFRLKRPLYAMTASLLTGITASLILSFVWGLILDSINETGLTGLWLCASTLSLILWGVAWGLLTHTYEVVRHG